MLIEAKHSTKDDLKCTLNIEGIKVTSSDDQETSDKNQPKIVISLSPDDLKQSEYHIILSSIIIITTIKCISGYFMCIINVFINVLFVVLQVLLLLMKLPEVMQWNGMTNQCVKL